VADQEWKGWSQDKREAAPKHLRTGTIGQAVQDETRV
jgi:hypothetical protein